MRVYSVVEDQRRTFINQAEFLVPEPVSVQGCPRTSGHTIIFFPSANYIKNIRGMVV